MVEAIGVSGDAGGVVDVEPWVVVEAGVFGCGSGDPGVDGAACGSPGGVLGGRLGGLEGLGVLGGLWRVEDWWVSGGGVEVDVVPMAQLQVTLGGQVLGCVTTKSQKLTCVKGPTPWTTCRAFPGANGLPNPLVGLSWDVEGSWLGV